MNLPFDILRFSAGIGVGTVVNWLWNNPHAILVLLWVPFGLESLLSGLDAGSSFNDVSIKAEVWNEIVLWGRLSFLLWVPDVLQLLLRVFNVLFGGENVSILSEVWHFVSSLSWTVSKIAVNCWSENVWCCG